MTVLELKKFCKQVYFLKERCRYRVLPTVKNSVINAVFPIWQIVELPNFFLNWDSLHAILNSHCKAWSYRKKKHKKIKAYKKSV